MKPSADLDDAALVRLCRAGDERAWRILVDRYEGLVMASALRTGLAREAALDVLQQVWVEVHRSLDRIRNPRALPRWLMVATRRIAYRRAVKNKEVLDELGEDLIDPAALPEEEVASMEQRLLIHRALQRLSDTCQKLLRMLFLADRPASYQQIASATGLAVGTLGSTRARCLGRLRKILEESP